MANFQALNNLKQATQGQERTQAPAKQDKLSAIMASLQGAIAASLPSFMTVDRVSRVALTELRTNQYLQQAVLNNPNSFRAALLKAVTLGLEVGNGLGHAYLVPYRKKDGSSEIQLIIGYRGMIELARRSGQIMSLYAVEVYEGEKFSVTMGLNMNIEHERSMDIDPARSKVVAVYAVAKLKGGDVQFDVMTRPQIEAIRKQSKAAGDGPWVLHWTEMAKKTVTRRLFKWLPVSVEVVGAGSTSLANVDDDGLVFDHDTGEILSDSSANDGEQTKTEVTSEQGVAKGDLFETNVDSPRLTSAIDSLMSAPDIDALNETFQQLERDFQGDELLELKKAYQRSQAEF